MTGVVAVAPTLGGFTVSVDTITLSGIAATATVTTTGSVTATPNVTGSYSYQWLKASGDTLVPGSGTSPTTDFSVSMAPGENRVAFYYCQVTNSSGFVALSPNVLVDLTRT